ncbi:MAG: pseudouridine synthase [Thermodesulfobacteriota bacterium]
MAMIRLQKFLAQAGVCSRRKGEEFIQAGLVKVNGRTVTTLGTSVDPEADCVEFQGKVLKPTGKYIYIALNKPKGYVTSCRQQGAQIVLDLIPAARRIYPVGRLDKDSTGLLLLTNDGELHQQLSHPSFDHEKEYDVMVAAPLPDGALRKLADGLSILGRKTRPTDVSRVSPRRFRIILREGRNRQIRRMVAKIGGEVVGLRRLRIATIELGDLAEGKWRHLTRDEIAALKKPAPALSPGSETASTPQEFLE